MFKKTKRSFSTVVVLLRIKINQTMQREFKIIFPKLNHNTLFSSILLMEYGRIEFSALLSYLEMLVLAEK